MLVSFPFWFCCFFNPRCFALSHSQSIVTNGWKLRSFSLARCFKTPVCVWNSVFGEKLSAIFGGQTEFQVERVYFKSKNVQIFFKFNRLSGEIRILVLSNIIFRKILCFVKAKAMLWIINVKRISTIRSNLQPRCGKVNWCLLCTEWWLHHFTMLKNAGLKISSKFSPKCTCLYSRTRFTNGQIKLMRVPQSF